MRAAKTAIPAYLSRLAGATAARGPQLHPLRPLFGPTVGDPLGPDPMGPAGEAAGWTNSTSFGAPDNPPRQPPIAAPNEPPHPLPPSPRSSVEVRNLPAAQSLSQPVTPRPPANPIPGAVVPSPRIDPVPPRLSTMPAPPVTAPAVERIVTPRIVDASPQARPATPPGLPPQAPQLPVRPDIRPPTPDAPLESRSVPAQFEPTALVPPLVPPRREPDRPQPSVATVPAATQVSIGTIEVLVTPPPQAPVPNLHQPGHPALPTHTGRASTDAARRQARRWFGAGQS